ncbi:MAG: hypothetical protein M1820_001471 [Bogoriella megaspora]|nr:MAG: hypothetical protein M1820_001471 [Bogoriella megaspora]
MTTTLENLPPELQLLVFINLTSRSDALSLILTSSRFRNLYLENQDKIQETTIRTERESLAYAVLFEVIRLTKSNPTTDHDDLWKLYDFAKVTEAWEPFVNESIGKEFRYLRRLTADYDWRLFVTQDEDEDDEDDIMSMLSFYDQGPSVAPLPAIKDYGQFLKWQPNKSILSPVETERLLYYNDDRVVDNLNHFWYIYTNLNR